MISSPFVPIIPTSYLGPFNAKLQYYPPNPTQTANFRSIIIDPEPDQGQTCKPYLDRFVMNFPRVSLSNVPMFLIQAQCVTIIGTVSWTHYFNEDGDANFNVVPDPRYKKYMSAGNFAPYFIRYTTPAIHMEGLSVRLVKNSKNMLVKDIMDQISKQSCQK